MLAERVIANKRILRDDARQRFRLPNIIAANGTYVTFYKLKLIGFPGRGCEGFVTQFFI